MGIKNSYVKEGTFKTTTPKTVSSNIKPGTVLGNSRGTGECLAGDWLQGWFDAHIVAHFRHQLCCKISDLIVSYDGKSAH